MIELLRHIPQKILETEREAIFEKVTYNLLDRGKLIQTLNETGVDFDSDEFKEFQKNDDILMRLFVEEKSKIQILSGKIGKNRNVILKYLGK